MCIWIYETLNLWRGFLSLYDHVLVLQLVWPVCQSLCFLFQTLVFVRSFFEFGFANGAQSLELSWTTFYCCLDGAYIGPNMDERDDLVICNA